ALVMEWTCTSSTHTVNVIRGVPTSTAIAGMPVTTPSRVTSARDRGSTWMRSPICTAGSNATSTVTCPKSFVWESAMICANSPPCPVDWTDRPASWTYSSRSPHPATSGVMSADTASVTANLPTAGPRNTGKYWTSRSLLDSTNDSDVGEGRLTYSSPGPRP